MSAIRVLSIGAIALALGSCATGPRPTPRHCGIGYTYDHKLENGSPLPACALPSPKQIAEACAFVSVSDEDGELEVSNVRCRYVLGDRSKARCSFMIRQLVGYDGEIGDDPEHPVTPWRPARAGFTYRYFMFGDDQGHVNTGVLWNADAKCRPSGPEGQLL